MSRLDTNNPDRDAEVRVRIPADVDRPDRLLAGLTARQLACLALPAVALWAAWAALHRHVPLPVFAALGAPVAVGAGLLALGRRDGMGADRFVALALRHFAAPRRLVPAPEGVAPTPAVVGQHSSATPAALRLPIEAVREDGTLDLGRDGTALICRAVGVSFGLRTATERAGMVAALARYLNGTGGPLEIVVRAEPVDLGPAIARLREAAGGLPHPALEAAALDHAAFLDDLAASRDLLSRDVLVVFRDPALAPPEKRASTPRRNQRGEESDVRRDGAIDRLRRRAADAQSALQAAGVQLQALDAAEVVTVFAAALDPLSPRRRESLAEPDAPVRGPALRGASPFASRSASTTPIVSHPTDAPEGGEA